MASSNDLIIALDNFIWILFGSIIRVKIDLTNVIRETTKLRIYFFFVAICDKICRVFKLSCSKFTCFALLNKTFFCKFVCFFDQQSNYESFLVWYKWQQKTHNKWSKDTILAILFKNIDIFLQKNIFACKSSNNSCVK